MTEKKACSRCNRQIDAVARICPYCNLDQSAARQAAPTSGNPTSRPPQTKTPGSDKRWTTKVLIIAAVAAVLVAVFAVGALVNGLGSRSKETKTASDTAPATETTSQPRSSNMADLRLIPVGETTVTTTDPPMTSVSPLAPNQLLPEELQRNDVTALPSEQYARIVEEARPTPKPAPKPAPIEESRESTSPVAPPSSEQARPGAAQSRDRTDPVAIYQPLPKINRAATLRFRLTIGRDGRVKEVQMIESAPGVTDKVIAAIQTWKFRPATVDGLPVEGTFPVDLVFKGDDDDE